MRMDKRAPGIGYQVSGIRPLKHPLIAKKSRFQKTGIGDQTSFDP
jgi:hypothetical protein